MTLRRINAEFLGTTLTKRFLVEKGSTEFLGVALKLSILITKYGAEQAETI